MDMWFTFVFYILLRRFATALSDMPLVIKRLLMFSLLGVSLWLNLATVGFAQVFDLRCDGLAEPLGIETATPHFSWKNKLTHNGQRQTAYEIQVASTRSALEHGEADLWSSGRIVSDEQTNILYGGLMPQARQLCHWRVRTWDERDSCSGWSRPQRFGVAPFSGIMGEYIGHALPDGKMDETPMLRTFLTYDRPAPNRSVLAYVNSLGYHELYVNRQRVGDEVLQPAVSQLDKRSLIVVYDISPYLQEGTNEILIWAGQGWFRDVIFDIHAKSDLGRGGNACRGMSPKSVSGPLVKAEVCEIEGKRWRTLAVTDSTWETSPSGYGYTDIWLSDMFGGERYDANVTPDWTPADVFHISGTVISVQQFEGNHILDEISPQRVSLQDDGTVILDFGRVVTGWLQVEFEPIPQGTVVTMEYTDHIFEDGVFQCQGERDYYVAGKTDENTGMFLPANTFRNRFHHHAFRYVRIVGAKVMNVKALRISGLNPAESASFCCNDTQLNHIHDLVKYTLQCLTFSGYMVDCPHIERMGYGGDGNASTITLQTMYDVLPTYLNWLTAWADSQEEDGGLAYVAPSYPTAGGPYWSGFIIKAPWRTWVNYGDLRMVFRLYEPMKRWLNYVDGFCEENLLQPWPDTRKRKMFLGDWLAPEGVDSGGESPIFVSNCFLSECLSDMSKMAKLLGYSDDCDFFTEKRKQLNTAIQNQFYHPEKHAYANGTPLDQAYALLLGLPTDIKMNENVEQQMIRDIRSKYKRHIAMGLMGIPVFTEWVTKNGQAELMASLLRQPDYPGYLNMIARGATTTWESWDGERSRVHNCYNGIGSWFYQALAGIMPDEEMPGYRNFFLAPQPVSGIDWLSAVKPTPYGEIHVQIMGRQGCVTVPVGATATLNPHTPNEQTLPAGKWHVEFKDGEWIVSDR